jgi:hypothetical protein
MMQREQMEAIIKSLDTESLQKMLSVVGINVQPMPGEELIDAAEGSKMESWNDTRVPISRSQRPPISAPESYLKEMEQRETGQQPPQYLGQQNNPEDWYAAGPTANS